MIRCHNVETKRKARVHEIKINKSTAEMTAMGDLIPFVISDLTMVCCNVPNDAVCDPVKEAADLAAGVRQATDHLPFGDECNLIKCPPTTVVTTAAVVTTAPAIRLGSVDSEDDIDDNSLLEKGVAENVDAVVFAKNHSIEEAMEVPKSSFVLLDATKSTEDV